MKTHQITFIILVLMSSLIACLPGNQDMEDSNLLAEAFNKKLYRSDLEWVIPENVSSEDSLLIIKAYIDRWCRDAVLMHEAEHNFPQDLNLDKLVRDYRASLVRLNYEKVLVEELLDSTITKTELEAFYERNKDQYQLETPIMQCRFIKVARNKNGINELQQWWNSGSDESLKKIKDYCKESATISQLKDSLWFDIDEIAGFMPQGLLTIDNVSSRRDFIQKESDYIYFFKVLDLVSKKEIAPFSYIKDQASKVILHRRKMKILEDMKRKMYDEALRKNNIKVY